MDRLNLAARAGRWSAEHWKTATAIWIVVVLVAIAAGRMAGTHKLSDAEQATGETARAEHILASAGFSTPASESVLVRSASSTADDPARAAGRVRHEGQGRQRGQAGAAVARRRLGAAAGASRLHDRRVRDGERESRTERHDPEGLPARRVVVGAGHLLDPADRLRRLRRRRGSGAARLLGRARL